MKMDHTRCLSARLHAALTLFDPGIRNEARGGGYRSFGLSARRRRALKPPAH